MSKNIVSGVLRDGLYTRVVGRRLVYLQTVSSTMDEAARLASEGAEDGTVVVADEQTRARGRFQRTWVTEKGNLYLSIVLRPSMDALQYLSIVSSLAVARAIKKATHLALTIKWPNDVRLRGKKVCGILVEDVITDGSLDYAVVGMGLNVALDPSGIEQLADIATGIDKETGKKIDRGVLLTHLLQEMDGLYLSLQRASGKKAKVPDQSSGADPIVKEWRGLLDTLGKRVDVRWGEAVLSGYAEDVDQVGDLLLRLDDGELMTLPAGEVTTQT